MVLTPEERAEIFGEEPPVPTPVEEPVAPAPTLTPEERAEIFGEEPLPVEAPDVTPEEIPEAIPEEVPEEIPEEEPEAEPEPEPEPEVPSEIPTEPGVEVEPEIPAGPADWSPGMPAPEGWYVDPDNPSVIRRLVVIEGLTNEQKIQLRDYLMETKGMSFEDANEAVFGGGMEYAPQEWKVPTEGVRSIGSELPKVGEELFNHPVSEVTIDPNTGIVTVKFADGANWVYFILLDGEYVRTNSEGVLWSLATEEQQREAERKEKERRAKILAELGLPGGYGGISVTFRGDVPAIILELSELMGVKITEEDLRKILEGEGGLTEAELLKILNSQGYDAYLEAYNKEAERRQKCYDAYTKAYDREVERRQQVVNEAITWLREFGEKYGTWALPYVFRELFKTNKEFASEIYWELGESDPGLLHQLTTEYDVHGEIITTMAPVEYEAYKAVLDEYQKYESLGEAVEGGMSAEDLHSLGFTDAQIEVSQYNTVQDALDAGVSITTLALAGYSLSDVDRTIALGKLEPYRFVTGYTDKEGFTHSWESLEASGYTHEMMIEMGWSPEYSYDIPAALEARLEPILNLVFGEKIVQDVKASIVKFEAARQVMVGAGLAIITYPGALRGDLTPHYEFDLLGAIGVVDEVLLVSLFGEDAVTQAQDIITQHQENLATLDPYKVSSFDTPGGIMSLEQLEESGYTTEMLTEMGFEPQYSYDRIRILQDMNKGILDRELVERMFGSEFIETYLPAVTAIGEIDNPIEAVLADISDEYINLFFGEGATERAREWLKLHPIELMDGSRMTQEDWDNLSGELQAIAMYDGQAGLEKYYKDNYTQLPGPEGQEGPYVANTILEALKTSNPEVYNILTTEGPEALEQAFEEARQVMRNMGLETLPEPETGVVGAEIARQIAAGVYEPPGPSYNLFGAIEAGVDVKYLELLFGMDVVNDARTLVVKTRYYMALLEPYPSIQAALLSKRPDVLEAVKFMYPEGYEEYWAPKLGIPIGEMASIIAEGGAGAGAIKSAMVALGYISWWDSLWLLPRDAWDKLTEEQREKVAAAYVSPKEALIAHTGNIVYQLPYKISSSVQNYVESFSPKAQEIITNILTNPIWTGVFPPLALLTSFPGPAVSDQALLTAEGWVMKTPADIDEWLRENLGEVAGSALGFVSSVGATITAGIPIQLMITGRELTKGELAEASARATNLGVGLVVWPAGIAFDIGAVPAHGWGELLGAVVTFIIPVAALRGSFGRLVRKIDPRYLAEDTLMLQVDIAKLGLEKPWTSQRLLAYLEGLELAVRKRGKDFVMVDLEGKLTIRVSSMERFVPDIVYHVPTSRAPFELGMKQGEFIVGKTGLTPEITLRHGNFLWLSGQPAFQFGKEGLVAVRTAGKARLLPDYIYKIKDLTERRLEIERLANEGKLEPGLYGVYKGFPYGEPRIFEYEYVLVPGTRLVPVAKATRMSRVKNPITGETVSVYWFATELAHRLKLGVPPLLAKIKASAFQTFIQPLRELARPGLRPIEIKLFETGKALTPFSSKFRALELLTKQAKLSQLVKGKIRRGLLAVESSRVSGLGTEARNMVATWKAGVNVVHGLMDKGAPAIRHLDLGVVELLPKSIARDLLAYLQKNKRDTLLHGSIVDWLYIRRAKRPKDLDIVARNPEAVAGDIARMLEKKGIKSRVSTHYDGFKVSAFIEGKWVTFTHIMLPKTFKEMLVFGMKRDKPVVIDGVRVDTITGELKTRGGLLLRSGIIEHLPAELISRFKDIKKFDLIARYLIEQAYKDGKITARDRVWLLLDLKTFLEGYVRETKTFREIRELGVKAPETIAEGIAARRALEASRLAREAGKTEREIKRIYDEVFRDELRRFREEPFVITIGRAALEYAEELPEAIREYLGEYYPVAPIPLPLIIPPGELPVEPVTYPDYKYLVAPLPEYRVPPSEYRTPVPLPEYIISAPDYRVSPPPEYKAPPPPEYKIPPPEYKIPPPEDRIPPPPPGYPVPPPPPEYPVPPPYYPPRVPIPPPIPIPRGPEEELKEAYEKGIPIYIVRHGELKGEDVWRAVIDPAGQKKLLTIVGTGNLPVYPREYATGEGSMEKTSQFLGKPPGYAGSADLGFIDIWWDKEGNLTIKGGGLETVAGERMPETTVGISIPESFPFGTSLKESLMYEPISQAHKEFIEGRQKEMVSEMPIPEVIRHLRSLDKKTRERLLSYLPDRERRQAIAELRGEGKYLIRGHAPESSIEEIALELADLPEDQLQEMLKRYPDRRRKLIEAEIGEITGEKVRKPIRGEWPILKKPYLEPPSLKEIEL